MEYIDDSSYKATLNEILINLNDNDIKNDKLKIELNQKNIFIDDNIISKIFFFWNVKSTYINRDKSLDKYHFKYYSLIKSENNIFLFNKVYKYSFFSFYKTILKRNISIILVTIFLAFVSGIFDFIQYIFFKNLLSIINEYSISNIFSYYLYCLKFIIFKLFHQIILKNLYFYENYLPIKISNEIIILIYKKVISLTDEHSKDNLLGKIINLIQTDADNISFIFNWGPKSIITPIQLCIVLFNIYNNYKNIYLILIFIFILFICFFIGYIIQKKYILSNRNYLYNKDIRINSTNEIFSNLKEIKMNSLENYFNDIIDKKRKKELYHYKSIMKQGIANTFLFQNIGEFMIIVLLIYIRITAKNHDSNLIKSDVIITIILMFNKLYYPLYRFPVFITGLIDSYISGKRIIDFLNMKETKFNFGDSINLENKNICILGPNGGGKTTFIKYLMRNIMNKKMSYCSQEKFILDNTIRENILFGNKMEKEKYLNALYICQLFSDIKNFKEKDLKECKMNGIQLSGGQKSRVDLARAIYNDSDYYFFDDIFVSYDNKIRMLIFKNVFSKYLKKNNRNIIATFSNLNFLDKNNLSIFNYFIIIDNKQIKFKGDYNKFISSDIHSNLRNNSMKNYINSNNEEENLNKDVYNEKEEKKNEKETFFESKIKKAMFELGYYFCFGLIFYQVIYQIIELIKTKHILYDFKNFNRSKTEIIDKYVIICLINMFFNFMITSTQYNATFYLNKKITKKILTKILSAPLFSFLQFSKGSDIINRLSKDVEKIRYPLKFLQYVLRDIISLLVISIYTFNYSKIIMLLVLFNILLSYVLFIYFIDKGKLYNNLERDSHSPLINLFTESLKGNFYIQVYHKENYFHNLLYKALDKTLKTNIFKFGSIAMFQMYHEIICNINYFILLIFLINKYINNEINKEDTSILLTISLNLNESLCKLYRSILDLSLNKIYFDRLLQYDTIRKERDYIGIHAIPFSYGDIKLDNLCMRYKNNSELILKNINIDIREGEKIAIIGRTGSGKSSIILCLLRILQDNELISGKISINGININHFDLKELRTKISVISQKPFIFNDCSIKENIDPENKIKDKRILLNKIKEYTFMKKIMNKFLNDENDLNNKIIDLSLSEGEKQIICLCRTLIKNNKIIIMDEATSNIDLNTEKLIYDDFINNISKDTTIISILHKLDYIKYYDKIIELSEDGTIKIEK